MRTGKTRLRAVGVIMGVLATVLSAGQPATADPAVMASRSCTVTTQWTCVTRPPLWVGSGTVVHVATVGIPWTAPWEPGQTHLINSFVLLRNLDLPGDPEVVRDNQRRGEEHDKWWSGLPAGNYQAELHCPYSCQGATLYFAT